MNSDDLQVHGLVGLWLPLNHASKDDTLSMMPHKIGVYVIKASEPICRANGESDIAYIGKGTGGFGIYGRVQAHVSEGTTTTTSGRVRQWIDLRDDLQIGFILVLETSEADMKELELLELYELDHWELPPINRRMG